MTGTPDLDFSHLEPIGPDPASDPAPAGEGVSIQPEPRIDARSAVGARNYTLVSPFKVDGKWLRKVTIRYPTQGEIDAWGNGEIEGSRGLMLAMTGLHPSVFKALAWPDAAALHQMFSDMVPTFVIGPAE